jgi:LPXTG-site transpeptidase (sortase) family protein
VSKSSSRRARPSPYSYRLSGLLVTIVVLVVSTVVLTSYARANRIPENTGGPSVPTVTRIPSLGLNVPTISIVEQGAVLDPPSDPQHAGWWAGGALPGSNAGSVLITAHKLHGGGGAFDTLGQVKRGALVTVDTKAGVQNYEVVSIDHYDRHEFAEESPDLFRTDDKHRLVLITCYDWNGDDWNGNTVVIARATNNT